jgi:hypothetical protein
MRGYVVQFSARIKAENVSRKPQPWNGVKFMAAVVTDHEKSWPATELPEGTFDWQQVAFRAIVPDDAKQVTLVVGLEAVTGKAGLVEGSPMKGFSHRQGADNTLAMMGPGLLGKQ